MHVGTVFERAWLGRARKPRSASDWLTNHFHIKNDKFVAEKGGHNFRAPNFEETRSAQTELGRRCDVQGYLDDKKLPPDLAPPQGPRLRPTVGS